MLLDYIFIFGSETGPAIETTLAPLCAYGAGDGMCVEGAGDGLCADGGGDGLTEGGGV